MEKKKEYQSPSMQVIELKHQNNLLSGSEPSPFGEGPLN